MSAFLALLRRDLRLARRVGAGVELGLLFFLILIAVVPFALGPDQKLRGWRRCSASTGCCRRMRRTAHST